MHANRCRLWPSRSAFNQSWHQGLNPGPLRWKLSALPLWAIRTTHGRTFCTVLGLWLNLACLFFLSRKSVGIWYLVFGHLMPPTHINITKALWPWLRVFANVRIFLGISERKTVLACLGEGYPLDIPESLKDIPLLTQPALFFFFFPRILRGISPG